MASWRGATVRGRAAADTISTSPSSTSPSSSKPSWNTAPTTWSRRGPASPSASGAAGAVNYPANTFPGPAASLGTSTPSKISELTAKFEAMSPVSSPPVARRREPEGTNNSWKTKLKPAPAAPEIAHVPETVVSVEVSASVPPSAQEEPPQVEETPTPIDSLPQEVQCSLCDHCFVLGTSSACPMCGEEYGAEASEAESGAETISAPFQVECALCDNQYEYPTRKDCPMCGEPYGAVEEPTPAAPATAGGQPAPGSITAMLLQLQKDVQAQYNLQPPQIEEEHRVQRAQSIEEESKRMVMCGHCNHTYEYPTFNFCYNCGHPSSNASQRLSIIKRQTWASTPAALEQMLAAAASANSDNQGAAVGQVINFCPDCGTPSDGSKQRFCGMCGKSFWGDEPALPDFEEPTSPTVSTRAGHETGERDKLKKKSKSLKKASYRTYFKEVGASPLRVKRQISKRVGRDDKSSRGIEVKSDWQHTVTAALPSTPDAIAAYKQMMIAKYEAQQKENVFIRSTSRRGLSANQSTDTISPPQSPREGISPQMTSYQAPLSPRGGHSYRVTLQSPLASAPSALNVVVGHEQIDQQIANVLASLNLSKYGAVFAQEEVTYDAFLLLESEDLAQMGIPIGPRKLILAKINEIKREVNA